MRLCVIFLYSCATQVAEIALNQGGLASDRKLLLIDRNRDLFLTPVHRSEPVKLATVRIAGCV